MGNMKLTEIGEALERCANASYDRAWSMPGAFYMDPGVLALERENLFKREWICVGRVEELSKPGDYMTFNNCGEPILLMHGEDGVIRAFSNICRHRGALIAQGSGNRKRLACPYHMWVYDNRGRLVGTPGLGDRPDFDQAKCSLPEFRCETWMGFVFVTLANDAAPIAQKLSGLEPLVRNYHMEQMTLRFLAEEIWETNWKSLLENFMEGYHLSPLHRDTLHPVNPTRLCSHYPAGESYFGYNARFSPTLPRSQKGHPDLTNDEADNCVMYAVPPGLVVGCAGDYSSFLCIQPEAIDRVRVKMGLVFFGQDWPQDRVDWAVELFKRTMSEDKTVLRTLVQGLSSMHYRPGPLARADYEGPTLDFYRYLHRRMGGALEAVEPSKPVRRKARANTNDARRDTMNRIIDLDRYPLNDLQSPAAKALIAQCQAELSANGMFNLPGFVREEVVAACAKKLQPRLDKESFTHKRRHNVYFLKSVPGLAPDHPALKEVETVNHTLCWDQIADTDIAKVYEWPPLAEFLAKVMQMPKLHVMDDNLARANVMAYRAGETLNWHFDRSHFTTTLLIQSPEQGGEFMYRSALRSDDDPNYDGVARLLRGEDNQIRTLPVRPGTLNVFRGKNTLHRVSPPSGDKDRIIAIFSYYDRPGVRFSDEENKGFYGRTR